MNQQSSEQPAPTPSEAPNFNFNAPDGGNSILNPDNPQNKNQNPNDPEALLRFEKSKRAEQEHLKRLHQIQEEKRKFEEEKAAFYKEREQFQPPKDDFDINKFTKEILGQGEDDRIGKLEGTIQKLQSFIENQQKTSTMTKAQQEAEYYKGEMLKEIGSYLEQHSEKFPVAAGMKANNVIYNLIVQDYEKYAGMYGEQYADSWLQDVDFGPYVDQAQKSLDPSLKGALKSKVFRSYLMNLIADMDSGPEEINGNSNPPTTLSNETFRPSNNNFQPRNPSPKTDEELLQEGIRMLTQGR